MNTSTSNIDSILNALDQANNENVFTVYLPVLKKDVKSKILNTDQLKKLFKSLVDSPLQNSLFTQTFNQIMSENIIEEDVNNLTVVDKAVYFVALRTNSIASTYTVNLTEEDIKKDDLKSAKVSYDLSHHLKNVVLNFNSELERSVTSGQYTVVCGMPTIKVENLLEKELHKNVNVEVNSPEELRQLIGDAFINEITKYIKSLTVNSEVIDFTALDFKSRILLVSKLPTTLINGVLKYMESCKLLTDSVMKFPITVYNNSDSNVSIVKEIPFDASFFNE